MAALLTAQTPMGFVLSLLWLLVHIAVACRALTRPDRSPASRIAWVAVIMAVPWLGIVAYLLVGETSIGRGLTKSREQAKARMRPPRPSPVDDAGLPAAAVELFEVGRSISGFPASAGNRITLIGDPDAPPNQPMHDSFAAIDALVADIDAAGMSVHISFYIWLDDGNGGKVVEALCAAAARGVTCRVMVDALGSRAFVKSARWQQLKDAGVHAIVTFDDIPRIGHLAVGRLDLRDHRKIVVIDNAIAYCGSQNCADPQFRVAAKYAPWVDVWLRCEGPVVRQEQHIFLVNWIAETGEQLEELPAAMPEPPRFDDGAPAQIFGTGPTTRDDEMSDAFVATIFAARHELIITTPYFVPDEALLRALAAAPRRGVETTLVVPARNNSVLVAAACRSTYEELLGAGVKIYEYPLGLLHTKTMTVDGRMCLVGSANMDRRSLQLNFEINMFVADEGVTAAVRARQEGYLSVSRPVEPQVVANWGLPRRIAQNTVGMLSPLL